MLIAYSFKDCIIPRHVKNIALAVGCFDGVHLGHQTILKAIIDNSDYSVLVSFKNHPSFVLKNKPVSFISTIKDKEVLLQNYGLDQLIHLTFSYDLSKKSPKEFIEEIRTYIPFTSLIVGDDGTIGNNKSGNLAVMKTLGSTTGFKVIDVPSKKINSIRISSSFIRTLISTGQFNEVNKCLGRTFYINGKVCPGAGIGKTLGFPTANICISNICTPPCGVYLVKIQYLNKSFYGLANIGYAPTVQHNRNKTLEVFIFDIDQELYNQQLSIEFISFIRKEKKFLSKEDLIFQINKDIKFAQEALKEIIIN